MPHLILVTFAMLAWCFYVMSGGPDFEPRGLRAQQPDRVASAPVEKRPLVTASQPSELVTKVVTRTVPVRATPEPVTDAADPVAAVKPEDLRGFSRISAFDGQEAGFTLASLEDGVAGLKQIPSSKPTVTEQTAEAEPQKDIREISGTRVNMRDGPGTIYPIIAKVQLGQKVEVLDDPGTGWLRLRVLPVQQIGWISKSLVSKSAN